MKQVEKQEDGSLSRINLAVMGEHPDKLSIEGAEKVLRSAARRVFVDTGAENLETSQLNGEVKHGTVAINEGLINKYRAAYALKPIGSVGNPDEVKEIGFESEANSAINTKERSSEVSKEEIRTGPMSRKLLMTRPQQ